MSIIFFMEKILKKKAIDIRIIYIVGKKKKKDDNPNEDYHFKISSIIFIFL
jgi:hypothetical protein